MEAAVAALETEKKLKQSQEAELVHLQQRQAELNLAHEKRKEALLAAYGAREAANKELLTATEALVSEKSRVAAQNETLREYQKRQADLSEELIAIKEQLQKLEELEARQALAPAVLPELPVVPVPIFESTVEQPLFGEPSLVIDTSPMFIEPVSLGVFSPPRKKTPSKPH